MNLANRRIPDAPIRRGSFIVESVVTIALLATAFIALGRLAAASTAISQNADGRLAATLAAENALEQLRGVAFDAISPTASKIGETIHDSYGYEVQIATNEFRMLDRDALHLVVSIRSGTNVSVTLHDWRFDDPAPSQQGSGDE